MVARGDLGIETSLTDLPNIQRRICMHVQNGVEDQ